MARENTGYQGTTADMLRIWRKYAQNWKSRSSPWRVSKGDIDIYRNILKKERSGKKVLVLGSTPEMRDLASKIDPSLTLIDICPEMITAMGKMLKVSKFEKETHIIGDWRSMPFLDSSFDIILGEYIWLMFSTADQKILIDELARILKPNGIMLSRSQFCDTDLIGKNLEELVAENLPPKNISAEKQRALRETLLSRVLDATTNPKTQRQETAKAEETVRKMIAKKKYAAHKHFLRDLHTSLYKRTNWSSNSREQLIPRLSKRFVIEDAIVADDYKDSVHFPVLKLRKK